MNGDFVYHKLIDVRKRISLKFKNHDLVRTADLKKTFSKSYTTNWSYILCKITEIINDTIPSYGIDNLPERYNEAVVNKTNLTIKEYKNIMKELNLN